MAKCNTKAERRLRKLKKAHQRQIRQLKQAFDQELLDLQQSLQPTLYSQCFYHEAMMNLLTSQDEPESDILIGAMVTQRWLRESGQATLDQLDRIQSWLDGLGANSTGF